MIEIWKPVKNYEGLYEVSNYGRVKSLYKGKRRNGKILKSHGNRDGYLKVLLYNDGKHKWNYIHIIVAQSFIQNPNNYTIVHHKDGNEQNNYVENLEWIDEDTHRRLHAEEQSKMVAQYDFNTGELIAIWESASECARNGYNQGHVSACCRGEEKQHKGSKWSYLTLNNHVLNRYI